MRSRKVRNYQLFAGGHLWQVASATVTSLPDGTEAIASDELERIHKAVANAVRGPRWRVRGRSRPSERGATRGGAGLGMGPGGGSEASTMFESRAPAWRA
jgi:hypothetical protein